MVVFQDSTNDGKSNKLDQVEMARRGYKFQKKRYQLPKVNKKLKKNISFIGKSVKKTGRYEIPLNLQIDKNGKDSDNQIISNA